MSSSKPVRLGVIGLGNMGRSHISSVEAGKVAGVVVTAVCDVMPDALKAYPDYRHYSDPKELIASGEVDAVLIATPHYDHPPVAIAAFKAGLHVMCEKPIAVHKADAEAMIDAYQNRPNKRQQFAAMFQLRTSPVFRKVRELITSGELGDIMRMNWICTSWFRSEAYYASGGWRATWQGEGGGVLLNQCPHNLDLLWWLFGMPSQLRSVCRFGKWHDIEVEDDVTTWMQFPNGASGVFVASTGEAPGTNRLEIAANRGRLVVENGTIIFERNETPIRTYNRKTKDLFGTPSTWRCEVPAPGDFGKHPAVLQNFAEAIRGKAKLIAPAVEGLYSVELANAMIYSSLQDETIEFPLDGKGYERELKKLCKNSRYHDKAKKAKKGKRASASDFAKSSA